MPNRISLGEGNLLLSNEVSPDWNVLLAPFQSLFSKAGFRYFCAFVRVFAHLDDRLWVTQVIPAKHLERHWTNYCPFLHSPAWEVTKTQSQKHKHKPL